MELTPDHARVLRYFEAHGIAPAAEVAAALGLPVAVVEALCEELDAEGSPCH